MVGDVVCELFRNAPPYDAAAVFQMYAWARWPHEMAPLSNQEDVTKKSTILTPLVEGDCLFTMRVHERTAVETDSRHRPPRTATIRVMRSP